MEKIIYEGIEFLEPDFNNEAKNTYKTRQAIKIKLLKRMPCEICGKNEVFAHHEVYSDYLNVRWLCRSHHLKIHAIFRKLKNRNTYAYF